jgi:hypothetical protein
MCKKNEQFFAAQGWEEQHQNIAISPHAVRQQRLLQQQ